MKRLRHLLPLLLATLSLSAASVNPRAVQNYENLASLLNVLSPPAFATLSGRSSAGDGGGGMLYWDAASVAATNLGTVFQIPGRATGRWIRPIESSVNVMWFGAIGDGSSDDTMAIRAATSAAGVNGKLLFPPRTFLISGALTPLEGQEWQGNGAVLKRRDELTVATSTAITTSGAQTLTVASTAGFAIGMDVTVKNGSSFDVATHRINALTATSMTLGTTFTTAFPSGGTIVTAFPQIYSTAARVSIIGFEFDGNQANNTTLQKWQLQSEIVLASDGGVIRNVWIHDAASEGITLGGENPLVDHALIEDCQGNGIHLSGSEHAVISNTKIRRVNQSGTATGHADGCLIASNAVGDTKVINCWLENGISGIGSFDSIDNSRLLVMGTTFTNFSTYAVEANLPDATSSEQTFTGNKFFNAGTVWFSNNSSDATATNGPKSITFTGNILSNTKTLFSLVRGVVFTGNTITNSTTTDINVLIQDSKDVNAQKNILNGGGYGFYVTSSIAANGTNNQNIAIHGNILRNQWTSGISMFRPGIVNGSVKDNTIVGLTNLVSASFVPIYVNEGSIAEGNQVFAENGLYGIQVGNGAYAIDNKVITRSGMASIQTFAGSSNAYVRGNFVSAAVSDAGSPNNFVGFNPVIGEAVKTGSGLMAGSVGASLTNASAWNRLSIIDAADNTATNHTITAASGNIVITSKGVAKFVGGGGAVQIDSIPGTAASYINLFDSLNNKTGQIRGNSGYIRLAPENGSYAEIQSNGGTPWFQVGGTTGDTFFKGAGLSANTVLYLDANRQLRSLAQITKAARNALTPSNGMIIYQTDNTPGLRFYENGAWVKPTVMADP